MDFFYTVYHDKRYGYICVLILYSFLIIVHYKLYKLNKKQLNIYEKF